MKISLRFAYIHSSKTEIALVVRLVETVGLRQTGMRCRRGRIERERRRQRQEQRGVVTEDSERAEGSKTIEFLRWDRCEFAFGDAISAGCNCHILAKPAVFS